MVSGNDAAVALAEFIGGSVSGFADMMNSKASELNLTSTHFVSPHGLDNDEHYTTAYDLAILADYALKNTTFSKIVNTAVHTVYIDGKTKSLHNTNELLGNLEGVYGVKTGFTNGANRCLVTSCKRGNLDIICVVLGCDTKKNRTLDSINLINYVFNNFTSINIQSIIDKNFESWKNEHSSFTINKGKSSYLALYLKREQIPYENIAINNSNLNNITTPISFSSEFNAPINENSIIGRMDICINNTTYFYVDILNKNFIEKKDIIYYLNTFIKNYFSYFEIPSYNVTNY